MGDEACGSELQELAVRRKPARRTDRSDLGQLDQQLRPARDGSATLLHATADEPSLVAGKRHRRLASRSPEASSRRQVRGFEISPLDSGKLIERVVVSGCLLAIDFLAMADAKDKNDQAVFDRSTMLLHKGQ
jgi:hypothetical protein